MIQRFDVGPRMSELAVHNGVAYLAGQVAEDATQGVIGQTRQVLAEIDALLAKAGTDKTRILRAQIYLADVADFAGMNRAWDAWVVPGQAPEHDESRFGVARPTVRGTNGWLPGTRRRGPPCRRPWRVRSGRSRSW